MRNAEMKWTNHSKLAAYGIKLDGWPEGVPKQNPSSLSIAQNRAILDALERGQMKFLPMHPHATPDDMSYRDSSPDASAEETIVFEDTVDMSVWDAGEESTSMNESTMPGDSTLSAGRALTAGKSEQCIEPSLRPTTFRVHPQPAVPHHVVAAAALQDTLTFGSTSASQGSSGGDTEDRAGARKKRRMLRPEDNET